jgi:PAS domain S-box-containing protein
MARRKTSSDKQRRPARDRQQLALEAFVESLRWLQPIDQIALQIVTRIQQGFEVDWCGLLLRDDTRARLSLTRTAGPVPGVVTLIPFDDPRLKTLERTQRAFRIPGTRAWREWKDGGVCLTLPLIENKRWIGLIVIGGRNAAWSRADMTLLNKLRQHAGVAIENARRYSSALQSRDDLASVFEASLVASSLLDLRAVLERLAEHITNALGMDGITLSAWESQHDRLINWIGYHRRELDLRDTMGSIVPLQKLPAARQTMRDRTPRIVSATHTATLQQESQWLSARGIAQMLMLPLVARNSVIGLIRLYTLDPSRTLHPIEMQLAQTLSTQAAIAIDNARLIEELREGARTLEQRVIERTADLERVARRQMIEASKTQAIIESANDGVVVIDATQVVILVNNAAEQMLGRPRDRLLGLSLSELVESLGEAPLPWVRAMQEWIGGDTAHEERIELDGRTISIILSPVRLEGEVQGLVNVLRDVTRDVEINRSKSEFVSTVSHELRIPMTAMLGYVDLMAKQLAGPVTETQLEFLGVIRRNMERLTTLVNDLLDLSHIETGRINLRLECVALPEVVKDVVMTLTPRAQDHQHTVDVQVPAALPAVRADAARVAQILTNLIGNAINYTPNGGRITVAAQDDDRFVVVSVTDTGVGIDPEDHHRIFERFFRADDPTVRSAKGTGLGLPIVQQLVKLQGGRIWVSSQRGQGSTFFFTLPLWKPDEGDAPETVEAFVDERSS